MSEEHPHVVNLPPSELDSFLSEFPSEGPPSLSVVPLDAAPSLDAFAANDQEAVQPQQDAAPVASEVTDSVQTADATEIRTEAAEIRPALEPEPEPEPTPEPAQQRAEIRPRPASIEPAPIIAKAASSAKQATITDFPVHVTRPPTQATTALVPNPITLVDLLEKQGGLEWRRAVAVIHQICGLLKQQPSHQPILLEPRNILITHEGQVRLLPALSGGDPLVIQLGRLLRTMLTGNDAPPELRLLLAQATFELPIFESVDDVDRALIQLEKLDQQTAHASEFASPILPFTPVAETRPPVQTPASRSGRSILPKPQAPGRKRSARRDSLLGGIYAHGVSVTLVALAAMAVAALITTRPSLVWPSFKSEAVTPVAVVTPPVAATPAPTDPPVEATTAPARPETPSSERPASAEAIPAPALVPVDRPRERERPRAARNRPTTPAEADTAADDAPVPVATVRVPAPPARPTPEASRESERRAASLIAQGQIEKASIVFDALLLSNPLYEPDPTSLTPEALEAFRASQRNLLPNIAQKNFERARAALAAGDPDRALSLGREVAAILDRRIAEPSAQMREQVDELIATASALKTEADEIVYTSADKGVVAPRELSRQFPASGPLGVPPHRVGTLEMIIDKDGGVEFVKLHTPLNRYHERMIVSAAKAWRYRPATRNGKPVKYRLTVRINLPESGTDF